MSFRTLTEKRTAFLKEPIEAFGGSLLRGEEDVAAFLVEVLRRTGLLGCVTPHAAWAVALVACVASESSAPAAKTTHAISPGVATAPGRLHLTDGRTGVPLPRSCGRATTCSSTAGSARGT